MGVVAVAVGGLGVAVEVDVAVNEGLAAPEGVSAGVRVGRGIQVAGGSSGSIKARHPHNVAHSTRLHTAISHCRLCTSVPPSSRDFHRLHLPLYGGGGAGTRWPRATGPRGSGRAAGYAPVPCVGARHARYSRTCRSARREWWPYRCGSPPRHAPGASWASSCIR